MAEAVAVEGVDFEAAVVAVASVVAEVGVGTDQAVVSPVVLDRVADGRSGALRLMDGPLLDRVPALACGPVRGVETSVSEIVLPFSPEPVQELALGAVRLEIARRLCRAIGQGLELVPDKESARGRGLEIGPVEDKAAGIGRESRNDRDNCQD